VWHKHKQLWQEGGWQRETFNSTSNNSRPANAICWRSSLCVGLPSPLSAECISVYMCVVCVCCLCVYVYVCASVCACTRVPVKYELAIKCSRLEFLLGCGPLFSTEFLSLFPVDRHSQS
jgi:hypothetical protein